MPTIIPVPVRVSVGVTSPDDKKGIVRNFGSFKLFPYATTRNGALEVAKWLLMTSSGDVEELDDVALFDVIPKKLLWHVCQNTFESDVKSIPMVLTIDDQSWKFQMCAKELEYEQVHYMVEVEDEWMRTTEVSVADLIGEEQFVFCEREVLPTIDFCDISTVLDNMN